MKTNQSGAPTLPLLQPSIQQSGADGAQVGLQSQSQPLDTTTAQSIAQQGGVQFEVGHQQQASAQLVSDGGVVGASQQLPQGQSSSALRLLMSQASAPAQIGVFGPENVSFDQALPTISNAQKFILPVPAFDGEPLVYPEGTTRLNDDTGQMEDIGGQQILDWKGNPIGEEGMIFFNGKDKSWQAVPNSGDGVVILNQVTAEQGEKLMEKIQQFADNPSDLSLSQMKEVLAFAQEELDIKDMYNSDKDYIQNKMNAIESTCTGQEAFGLFRRDDRDICQAILIEGQGEFQGPAATGQKFDDGAVLIQHGEDVRLVQPEIFLETYQNADGTDLQLSDIPTQLPQ